MRVRLSLKLFSVFFLIVALTGYFVINVFITEIKPGVRSATENTLIDTANLLAQIASQDIEETGSVKENFAIAFANLNKTPIGAKVNGHLKNHVGYRVYITDQKGIVIFDSANKDTGKDYSKWNDVYLTLRGKYGARSTRDDPEDGTSSTMYVAAPIVINEKILGSLTVAKPNKEMASVIFEGEERIKTASITLVLIAFGIGTLFTAWFNHSINRLVKYAVQVSEGEKVLVPKLNSPELSTLAQALEQMRTKLEGKAYVEHYVLSLTHELKSPLAAVKGATEILQENPPDEVREHFLNNISQQNTRMQQLIERMLNQSRIENLKKIELQLIDLDELLTKIIREKEPQFSRTKITLKFESTLKNATVQIDRLLIEQAISNLVDNALDFTEEYGQIVVSLNETTTFYQIYIVDSGTGIPDFALDKIYDRFYSLPRPEKTKSTGLGLSFVREVALLHQGKIELTNIQPHGVQAIFSLKKYQADSF